MRIPAPLLCPLLLVPASALAVLRVDEVMFDPVSNETRWEWIEVYNTGDAAVDLDGWIIDRVGDRERSQLEPNISSITQLDDQVFNNPTVVPAGGIAVLYNGEGLAYDPGRFRAAWPTMPAGTTLIGVDGWSGNQLANSPKGSDYAPSLPAMTVGLWPHEAAYRADAADFGTPSTPNKRVFRVENAAAVLAYDTKAPWRDTLGRSTLHYKGGSVFQASTWGLTTAPWGNASKSTATFLPEPINGPDHGSPGILPPGQPFTSGLLITELMYNPASVTDSSKEWEWIEVFNNGSAIDFAATPHWLDDDDGADLEGPNLTTGGVGAGEAAVFFNASAATLEQMRAAWDQPGSEPINWIGVEAWPALNNDGDRFGFWDRAADYARDRLGDDATIANATVGLEYDEDDGWPLSIDGDAIRLENLGSQTGNPTAWLRARGPFGDPDAYRASEVFAPGGVLDSAGGDHGSPGIIWQDITSPLPGDYNRDGRVDAADYTLWRDGEPLPTETTTAGVTDAADLAVWQDWYGTTEVAPATAVPEPSVLALGLIGFGSALRQRRRLVAG